MISGHVVAETLKFAVRRHPLRLRLDTSLRHPVAHIPVYVQSGFWGAVRENQMMWETSITEAKLVYEDINFFAQRQDPYAD